MAESVSATVTPLPRRRRASRKLTRELVASLTPKATAYEVRDAELKGFLVRVEKSGTMTYYVEIARGKRLKVGRAAHLKPHIARDRAERILGNVANNRDPWEGIRQTKDDTAPSLGEFIAGSDPKEKDVAKWDGDYATWYRANRKEGRAYTENMQRLRAVFSDWWNMPLTEITPGMLETLKTERKVKHGNSNATIRRDLSRLRGVFRLARKRGFRNDAFEDVDLPGVDAGGVIRFLSDEERERLLAALETSPDYLRAMVLVSLNTGVRRGELFGLEWPNVDFKRNVLTVVGTTSKAGKTRHIPLNATARKALLDWKPKRAEGLVFPSRAGQFNTVKKSWRSLLKRAKVNGFRWHDMRHDFASRLVMKGIDLYTVGDLLGHDRAATTQKYAHLAPSHKSAAVEVLDD
ncbi:MAG TPA: tyrosine-type recombinase/integrase [Gammaproteobacteria bacterium]